MKLRLWGGLCVGLWAGIACNGDDPNGGEMICTPGQQFPCECPDGSPGTQQCLPDGTAVSACTCDGATGSGTPSETGTGGSGDDTSGSGCGNGVENPGECMMGDPAYCPEDCPAEDSTTGPDVCMDQGATYVTQVPMIPSRWQSGALIGFAAGQDLCREAALAMGLPEPGMVTVCDYEQVVQAELAGELAAIPAGTTAWLHRTTVADIMGIPTDPGSGGRCAEWSILTNDVADGEYVEFPGGGVVTYFLDDDTFYDGVDVTHTQAALLECGMQMRSILCCNPACTP